MTQACMIPNQQVTVVKIEIPGGELLAMVKAAGVAVATKTTHPVLTCVKFDAHDDLLTVSGTDLEVGHRRTVACVVRRSGVCCVPYTRLASVLSEIEGVVELSADGESLVVRVVGQKSRWTLPVFDSAEYPDFPSSLEGSEFTVPAADVAMAIDQSEWAAMRRDTSPRFSVNCLMVEAEGESVRFVGTDLKAIGAAAFKATVSGEWIAVLFPLKAAKAVRDLCGKCLSDVTVVANRSEVLVSDNRTTVWCRQVQGKFPMWKQILPKKSDHTFACDAAAFGAAVKRAAVTTDAENQRVDFTFSPGKAVLVARGAETGASEVEVELPAVDFDMQIAFDPHYLLAVCSAGLKAGCSEVTISLSGSVKPAVFEWAMGKAVVMPMSQGGD